MKQEEVVALNEVFDKVITDWIQNFNSRPDKDHREKILEKTRIIAEYRGDSGLLEMIKQRMKK